MPQEAIVIHPCDETDNGGCDKKYGACHKIAEYAVCSCKPGYMLASNGKKCKLGNTYTYTYRCKNTYIINK